MYLLLLTGILLIIVLRVVIKSRQKPTKTYELKLELLPMAQKGRAIFAPSRPEFSRVAVKVGSMYATVDAPTKSIKRTEYTLPG